VATTVNVAFCPTATVTPRGCDVIVGGTPLRSSSARTVRTTNKAATSVAMHRMRMELLGFKNTPPLFVVGPIRTPSLRWPGVASAVSGTTSRSVGIGGLPRSFLNPGSTVGHFYVLEGMPRAFALQSASSRFFRQTWARHLVGFRLLLSYKDRVHRPLLYIDIDWHQMIAVLLEPTATLVARAASEASKEQGRCSGYSPRKVLLDQHWAGCGEPRQGFIFSNELGKPMIGMHSGVGLPPICTDFR